MAHSKQWYIDCFDTVWVKLIMNLNAKQNSLSHNSCSACSETKQTGIYEHMGLVPSDGSVI